MPQFDVYENHNPKTKAFIPFLIEVQNDIFSSLSTTLVIPICPESEAKHMIMSDLTPSLEIYAVEYILLTPQLSNISRKELGERVLNLGDQSQKILEALDFLLAGL